MGGSAAPLSTMAPRLVLISIAPRADHADREALEVEAEQPAEGEIPLAHAVVGTVDAPVQRQDHGDPVLGHRIGRIGRHARHRDAKAPGGGEIHIVEPGRSQRNQPNAEPGQPRAVPAAAFASSGNCRS